MMILLPQATQTFVRLVQKHLEGNYEVYIAGGYLRDLYCSQTKHMELEPKDLDLILIPIVDKPSLEGVVDLSSVRGIHNQYTKNCDSDSDMNKRGVVKLIGLWTTLLDDIYDVQLIVYDKSLTPDELAADMDMNINQVVSYSNGKHFIEAWDS